MSMAIKIASMRNRNLIAKGILDTASLLHKLDFDDDEDGSRAESDLMTALSSVQTRDSTAGEENDGLNIRVDRS